jgi:predicted nucleic acid-binding Zn ribbon protein
MTYEYYCNYCHEYTTIQCKVSEYQEEIQCGCGGSAKRTYSPIRTLYKCEGFYSTDNRKENNT